MELLDNFSWPHFALEEHKLVIEDEPQSIEIVRGVLNDLLSDVLRLVLPLSENMDESGQVSPPLEIIDQFADAEFRHNTSIDISDPLKDEVVETQASRHSVFDDNQSAENLSPLSKQQLGPVRQIATVHPMQTFASNQESQNELDKVPQIPSVSNAQVGLTIRELEGSQSEPTSSLNPNKRASLRLKNFAIDPAQNLAEFSTNKASTSQNTSWHVTQAQPYPENRSGLVSQTGSFALSFPNASRHFKLKYVMSTVKRRTMHYTILSTSSGSNHILLLNEKYIDRIPQNSEAWMNIHVSLLHLPSQDVASAPHFAIFFLNVGQQHQVMARMPKTTEQVYAEIEKGSNMLLNLSLMNECHMKMKELYKLPFLVYGFNVTNQVPVDTLITQDGLKFYNLYHHLSSPEEETLTPNVRLKTQRNLAMALHFRTCSDLANEIEKKMFVQSKGNFWKYRQLVPKNLFPPILKPARNPTTNAHSAGSVATAQSVRRVIINNTQSAKEVPFFILSHEGFSQNPDPSQNQQVQSGLLPQLTRQTQIKRPSLNSDGNSKQNHKYLCPFCERPFDIRGKKFFFHLSNFHFPPLLTKECCDVPNCNVTLNSRLRHIEHISEHTQEDDMHFLQSIQMLYLYLEKSQSRMVPELVLEGETHNIGKFKCPLLSCGRVFSSVHQILEHMTILHFYKVFEKNLPATNNDKKFQCKFIKCHKVFDDIHALIVHLGIHHRVALRIANDSRYAPSSKSDVASFAEDSSGIEQIAHASICSQQSNQTNAEMVREQNNRVNLPSTDLLLQVRKYSCPFRSCHRKEFFVNEHAIEHIAFHSYAHISFEIKFLQEGLGLKKTRCPSANCNYEDAGRKTIHRHYGLQHGAAIDSLLNRWNDSTKDIDCTVDITPYKKLRKEQNIAEFSCVFCEKAGKHVTFGNQNALNLHFSLAHFPDKLHLLFIKNYQTSPQFCGVCQTSVEGVTSQVVHVGLKHKKIKELFAERMSEPEIITSGQSSSSCIQSDEIPQVNSLRTEEDDSDDVLIIGEQSSSVASERNRVGRNNVESSKMINQAIETTLIEHSEANSCRNPSEPHVVGVIPGIDGKSRTEIMGRDKEAQRNSLDSVIEVFESKSEERYVEHSRDQNNVIISEDHDGDFIEIIEESKGEFSEQSRETHKRAMDCEVDNVNEIAIIDEKSGRGSKEDKKAYVCPKCNLMFDDNDEDTKKNENQFVLHLVSKHFHNDVQKLLKDSYPNCPLSGCSLKSKDSAILERHLNETHLNFVSNYLCNLMKCQSLQEFRWLTGDGQALIRNNETNLSVRISSVQSGTSVDKSNESVHNNNEDDSIPLKESEPLEKGDQNAPKEKEAVLGDTLEKSGSLEKLRICKRDDCCPENLYPHHLANLHEEKTKALEDFTSYCEAREICPRTCLVKDISFYLEMLLRRDMNANVETTLNILSQVHEEVVSGLETTKSEIVKKLKNNQKDVQAWDYICYGCPFGATSFAGMCDHLSSLSHRMNSKSRLRNNVKTSISCEHCKLNNLPNNVTLFKTHDETCVKSPQKEVQTSESPYGETLNRKEMDEVTLCKLCNKNFVYATHLLLHLLSVHDVKPKDFLTQSIFDRSVICGKCIKKCVSPLVYALHYDRHQVRTFISCAKCSRRYFSPFNYFVNDSCMEWSANSEARSAVQECLDSLIICSGKDGLVGHHLKSIIENSEVNSQAAVQRDDLVSSNQSLLKKALLSQADKTPLNKRKNSESATIKEAETLSKVPKKPSGKSSKKVPANLLKPTDRQLLTASFSSEYFCLDCEKCHNFHCTHENHSRIPIGNQEAIAKHSLKLPAHQRFQPVENFLQIRKRVLLHDIVYSQKFGHKVRKQFKQLCLSGYIKTNLFSEVKKCRMCNYKATKKVDFFRHIREKHLTKKNSPTS